MAGWKACPTKTVQDRTLDVIASGAKQSLPLILEIGSSFHFAQMYYTDNSTSELNAYYQGLSTVVFHVREWYYERLRLQ
jgi:hypothetical protein